VQEAAKYPMLPLVLESSAAGDILVSNHHEWMPFEGGELDDLLNICLSTVIKQKKALEDDTV
jgi:hypothetical protein